MQLVVIRHAVAMSREEFAPTGRDDSLRPLTDRGRAKMKRAAAGLRELSPEHRAVIVLRHLLEYTPGEIARLLELPRGTVNSRLRRALDALGERLEER